MFEHKVLSTRFWKIEVYYEFEDKIYASEFAQVAFNISQNFGVIYDYKSISNLASLMINNFHYINFKF